MHIFDLNELAEFDNMQPHTQIIARSAYARHILFSFRAGQGLPQHSTTSEISVQVISGQLTFTANGQSQTLLPGQLLLLEANILHGVQAESDSVMLLTMTPDPQ